VNIKSQKDFFSGLMFLIVGGVFAYGATSYSIGSAARMGPGYFPLLLGVILAILGAFVLFFSLVVERPDSDPVGKFAWAPILYVLGSNISFGIMLVGLPSIGLPSSGMIASIFVLTLIASKAGDKFILREVLILATVLSVICYLAFIMLLKLQMPVWPVYITG
jgi:drug/metabolite transporter (DMT)-like permease